MRFVHSVLFWFWLCSIFLVRAHRACKIMFANIHILTRTTSSSPKNTIFCCILIRFYTRNLFSFVRLVLLPFCYLFAFSSYQLLLQYTCTCVCVWCSFQANCIHEQKGKKSKFQPNSSYLGILLISISNRTKSNFNFYW